MLNFLTSPTETLVVTGVVALLIAMPVYGAVREWCRDAPDRRLLLIAGAITLLVLVAMATPGIGALEPPYSESPAGIFVLLARVAVLGLVTVVALATLLGAIKGGPPPDA